ncbi:unnamed protein product [Bathycoccus prasinos]
MTTSSAARDTVNTSEGTSTSPSLPSLCLSLLYPNAPKPTTTTTTKVSSSSSFDNQFALGLLTFASTAADAFRAIVDRGGGKKEKKKKKKKTKKREEQLRLVAVRVFVREEEEEEHPPNTRTKGAGGVLRRGARTWHHPGEKLPPTSSSSFFSFVDDDDIDGIRRGEKIRRSLTPLPLSQRRTRSPPPPSPPSLDASFSVWRLSDDKDLNEIHDEYEDEFREEKRHVKRKQSFTPVSSKRGRRTTTPEVFDGGARAKKRSEYNSQKSCNADGKSR